MAGSDQATGVQLAIRGALGGVLMGLANLVPGVSGGTMLLASGVYPDFIEGVSDLTRLRWRVRSAVVLGSVGGAAALVILLLAGGVKDLVVDHRWAMYSLFIGLTLGGAPIVKGQLGRMTTPAWQGAVVGFLAMVALALAQAAGADGSVQRDGPLFMGIAGLLAAGAMILPGLSGGYLLLLIGAYVPILSGIDALKMGLKSAEVSALMAPLLGVVVPVGVGVVLGVGVVSNALKWFLEHQRARTLGVLMGLLCGAVFGLYPFQQGVAPAVGDRVKGQVVTEASLATLDREDWPTQWFNPSLGQLGGSLGLILLGLAATEGIRRVGSSGRKEQGNAHT